MSTQCHQVGEPASSVAVDQSAAVEFAAPAAPVPLPILAGPAPVGGLVGGLVVGHAEDRAEPDADRMADVALSRLRRLEAGGGPGESVTEAHQHGRGCDHLRRSATQTTTPVIGYEGGALDAGTSSAIEGRRSSGKPLDPDLQHRMEGAFGASFSGVRIHADDAAAKLNTAVSARAFTTGQDVFFGKGQFAPGTAAGDRVLAHELAHTLQQGGAVGRLVHHAPMKSPAPVVRRSIGANAPVGTRLIVTGPSSPDVGRLGTVTETGAPDGPMKVHLNDGLGIEADIEIGKADVDLVAAAGGEEPRPNDQALLLQMITRVIDAVQEDELTADVMSVDKTRVVPLTALDQLKMARDKGTAEQVATYLYTTYFYAPLNRYLRDPLSRPGQSVQNLISAVVGLLHRAFRGTVGEPFAQKFRMELKGEWIANKDVGDEIDFKGFTSLHPDLSGVNSMWGDIEAGTFGETSSLTLLVFDGSGDTKFLKPDPKHFMNENEVIANAGMKMKVTKKYQVANPEFDADFEFTVIHLAKVEGGVPSGELFSLSKSGYVYSSNDV